MISRERREENAIRTALEALECGDSMLSGPPLPRKGTKGVEAQRAFIELLGELPMALRPLHPRPRARRELLRRLDN